MTRSRGLRYRWDGVFLLFLVTFGGSLAVGLATFLGSKERNEKCLRHGFITDNPPALKCLSHGINLRQSFVVSPFLCGIVVCLVSLLLRLDERLGDPMQMDRDELLRTLRGTFFEI